MERLKEEEFVKKIKNLYLEKKDSRIKILGENQNNNLEKNFFTNYRFFMEITPTIFRTIATGNWFETIWSEGSVI